MSDNTSMRIDKREAHKKIRKAARHRKMIAEEEEKEGEKEKRETGHSLRAWSDPPPCSARLVITRQGRREREASNSSYGPLSFPSAFLFGLSRDPSARRPLSKLIFY